MLLKDNILIYKEKLYFHYKYNLIEKKQNIEMGPYHFFCAYGGSGSTYTLKKLGAFGRPDILWQPSYHGKKLIEWQNYPPNSDLLDEKEYDTINVNWDIFFKRTHYMFCKNINKKKSIKDNLINFCLKIENTNFKVLFGNAAVVNFFSENNFKNVTYIIRHPLHAYVSFSKKERHGEQMNLLGDINSKEAIDFWVDRWNYKAPDGNGQNKH